MHAHRWAVTSPNGTRLGLVTAGTGPALLLVHGGMCSAERWAPLWPLLAEHFEVTAMDRRGRGYSGDAGEYSIVEEYSDVAAVVRGLSAMSGGPVDVFGHSFGAVCALGAVTGGVHVRKLVLYEPPGPGAVSAEWLTRVRRLIGDGQVGAAMASFLIDVVGLGPPEVERLRVESAGAGAGVEPGSKDTVRNDPLEICRRTMVREAEALRTIDLPGLAAGVERPVLLLLGGRSPAWARQSTAQLLATMPFATVAELREHGHEAVDTAPTVVAELVRRYLLHDPPTGH